jgi:hypothetical protein
MSDVFSTFGNEVELRHKEMLDELESISVDDLKATGVSLSFGGKTFKFSDLEIVEEDTIEEKLRKEFKEKLNTQQQRIRDKINEKINQLLMMHQNKQQELDRKEEKMKRKYADASLMPEITEAHMLKGLSVVKGSRNDELIWIYRGVYNPRFIVIYDGNAYDGSRKKRKAIPARLVNRLKTDILILIKSKGKKITNVATKKLSQDGRTLPAFPHYHQTGNGDCWGSWHYEKDWNTPDDILVVAKDAEAVLETINQGSIANRGPAGMPRLSTLLKSVEKLNEVEPTTVEREGGNDEVDDVWQTI